MLPRHSIGKMVVGVVFAALVWGATAKHVSGLMESGEWRFMSKFCFNGPKSNPGILKIKAETDIDGHKLGLYSDESFSWPKVYGVDIPCQKKLQAEERLPNGTYVCPSGFCPCKKTPWDIPSKQSYKTETDVSQTQRPHFWYMAAAHCDSEINLWYDLHFINSGSGWDEEFSCDEQGLLTMYIFFFCLFFVGTIVHLYGVQSLRRAQAWHAVVKLLTCSVVLQLLSLFLYLIHYSVYSQNGYGAPGVKGLATVLDASSQLVFIVLLVVLGKGWTISKTTLDQKKLLLILFALYTFTYFAFFVWVVAGQDEASTTYVYESPPGIVIVCLRVITLIWFLYCIIPTHNQENDPAKRKFFKFLASIYSIWFLALPVMVAIAALLSPWVRFKTVTGITLCITSLAMGVLGFLLWPTRASQYFRISAPELLAGSTAYDEL